MEDALKELGVDQGIAGGGITVAVVLYGRYYKSVNKFIGEVFVMLGKLFKVKKKYYEVKDDIASMTTNMARLTVAVGTLMTKVDGIAQDQKKLNHKYTVSIRNGTVMETKLLEAIRVINYIPGDSRNIAFKSVLFDLSEIISKLYTSLRSKGVEVIDYSEQKNALSTLKFVFEKYGFKDEHKLDLILHEADGLLNKFNVTKDNHDNSNLINELYVDFVTYSYIVLTDDN